jgi:hypothetical protein
MGKPKSGQSGDAEQPENHDSKTPSNPEGKSADELNTLDEVEKAKSVKDAPKPDTDDGLAKGVEPKGKDLEKLEKREDELDPAPEPINHPAIGNYDPRDNAKNARPADLDLDASRNSD